MKEPGVAGIQMEPPWLVDVQVGQCVKCEGWNWQHGNLPGYESSLPSKSFESGSIRNSSSKKEWEAYCNDQSLAHVYKAVITVVFVDRHIGMHTKKTESQKNRRKSYSGQCVTEDN